MSDVQQLSDGRPDGTCMGQDSSALIGFYGATPQAKPAFSAMAAIATTAAINSSISSSCFGFTQAQADGIVLLVNAIRAQQVLLGLAST